MHMSVCGIVRQQRRLLAGFHEEMVPLVVDEPVHHVLFAFGAAAAGPRELGRRRRVYGKREEIRWLGEVGHQTPVEHKVYEDEDVHQEDEQEDDDPGAGGSVFNAA
jgi:hypothetical protein